MCLTVEKRTLILKTVKNFLEESTYKFNEQGRNFNFSEKEKNLVFAFTKDFFINEIQVYYDEIKRKLMYKIEFQYRNSVYIISDGGYRNVLSIMKDILNKK